jgi:PAS domain S-box-containing protein
LEQKFKVLLVEDEGLIAHDISTRLEAIGHEVVAIASTAEEAIEHASGADVVLMDIRIDGQTDGIVAATKIRDRHHVPVVFLTAHADRPTLDRAKVSGAFGYLVKPVAQGSLSTAIEIAVYKNRMERKLEEREALLRTTLGSVADAVVVVDHMSQVLMLNAAAEILTGWTQAEAEGKPLLRVLRMVDGVTGEPAEDPVPLAILKDGPLPLERSLQLISRDGKEMFIEGSTAPVKISGVVLGVVLTFRDVSARLWEEKQLRQSQKVESAGRIAARVSDEYTNLLGGIRNQAEQLLRQFGEYSPARVSIEEIQESAAAAEALTRRLASFGTRQTNQHPENLSLNGMLRRMSKLIESVAGPRIEMAIRPAVSPGQIRADAAQLEQAIMNLILHACGAMPEGGRLLVETGRTTLPRLNSVANYVTFSVTHTGHEPDAERLFEPTSIAEDGLALAAVHGIVTEHGGYISAQPVSGGFRFEMLLPAASETMLLETSQPEKIPSVLLVDYRESVRVQLHNFFEAQGYDLLEAADEHEALALGLVHEGSLDLLVAEAADAHRIGAELQKTHPSLQILRIVDSVAYEGRDEIRRPFSQAALLEKAAQLLREARPPESRAATSS